MKNRECPKCKRIIGLSKHGFFHRHMEKKGVICTNSWNYGGDIEWKPKETSIQHLQKMIDKLPVG